MNESVNGNMIPETAAVRPGTGMPDAMTAGESGLSGWLLPLPILAVLAWISVERYLLFHLLVELSCVFVAFSLFALMWNTRSIARNSYMEVIGNAFLFIGFLDLLHTLAYKGMGLLPVSGADMSTQLWIGTRLLESAVLLLAPRVVLSRSRVNPILATCSGLTALFLVSLTVWPVFPTCFTEQGGLTPFKIGAEYLICLILAGAAWVHYRRRHQFEPHTLQLVLAAIGLTIVSELSFTLYVSVDGIPNIFGHFCKLVSYYLIYQAMIVDTLKRPHRSLFRELEHSRIVQAETILQLKTALDEVKTLKGFLPICASCKQIRDDRGYWQQLEQYLSEHADVQFSHGMCPDCYEKFNEELDELDRQENPGR